MLEHLDDPVVLEPLSTSQRDAIQRRGSQLRRRRRALQIGIPAALATVAVTIAALSMPNLNAGPAPITSVTPKPTPTGMHVTPARLNGPFEAVILRGESLVAIDGHGHERTVRDLTPLRLSAKDLAAVSVSSAGWLNVMRAAKTGTDMVFLNLLDPQAKPVVVSGQFDARTWSPDGIHLAVTDYGGCGACQRYTDPLTGATTVLSGGAAVTVIDPTTGTTYRIDSHGGYVPGGGPAVVWTEDGTGVALWSPGPDRSPGKHLEIAPLDGGPIQTNVPPLWFWVGARYLTPEGLQLDRTHTARLVAPDGSTAKMLYDRDVAGTTLADATMARDGRSAVLLLTTAAHTSLLLARTNPGAGTPSVVATLRVDHTYSSAYLDPAPDDSTMRVSTNSYGTPSIESDYLVPLDGSPAYAAHGMFTGWVPTDVVNAIAAR